MTAALIYNGRVVNRVIVRDIEEANFFFQNFTVIQDDDNNYQIGDNYTE